MSDTLARFDLVDELGIVRLRFLARTIADRLGFEVKGQVEIVSAVSVVARCALRCDGGCRVEFRVEGESTPSLLIRVVVRGTSQPSLEGSEDQVLPLMDSFEVESDASDPLVHRVAMARALPSRTPPVSPRELTRIGEDLPGLDTPTPVDELIRQDRELIQQIDDCEAQKRELVELNRQQEETNRAILALDAELDDRAESLQRAGEMKRRFLSKVSHELRTPLASILSLTRLLLDRVDGDLSVEQERQVSFIDRASGDLIGLINDLLDLARIDAGREVVRPSEVHLLDLFAVLRAIFRPFQPAGSAVTLAFENPVSLPPLWTDRAKLTQILHSFLSNALKFTERGEVRVRAETGPGDSVVFHVSDPGIGIEPDQIERVFEEFGQVDSPLHKLTKGTGLGLSLASKLARLLGGRVDVRSEPGVGSTFTATIPIRFPGDPEPSA